MMSGTSTLLSMLFWRRVTNSAIQGRFPCPRSRCCDHRSNPNPQFHVDNLSSAHLYLRLRDGETWDNIPQSLLDDCAQLTKANSIEGRSTSTSPELPPVETKQMA